MVSKNWFGGRVLMPFESYNMMRRAYFGEPNYAATATREKQTSPDESVGSHETETEEHYQLKSLLNVIADSGVVETYLLTKAELQYLPDSELKIIFQYFVSQREPDRPSTKETIDA